MDQKGLEAGLAASFIDENIPSKVNQRAEFVINDHKEGRKVLSSIEYELTHCEAFYMSVAFITLGGLTPLLSILKELEEKGIPGKILTTDYLMFTDPKALRKLASLKNITLKIFQTYGEDLGFHTKGYIFKSGDLYKMIIGSSNMTLTALTKNKEWNTKLISTSQGAYIKDVKKDFYNLWNDPACVNVDDFIEDYEKEYLKEKVKKRIALLDQEEREHPASLFKPNDMQNALIRNLKDLYAHHEKRALLISATGTGKTYASAFGMKALGFHRILFVVHRESIAKQAMRSYQKIFGSSYSYGLLSGSERMTHVDLLFATVQTLRKDEILKSFAKDEFEGIVIDEAHHSSANSYTKIMDYFTPKFYLGMSATPDRRDEKEDIYAIFDHNIACEIRLQDAMEEDLLCPFHYFGITDLSVVQDQSSRELNMSYFRELTSDERVNHIMEKASYYGYSGERVKGLIFTSRIDEAEELSKKFNERGWRTLVVSGKDSPEARAKAIERLATDRNDENSLDYILSVDVFSEGVDVPEINQVIMLRPTQSPIVFIQQLGRGLRKAFAKEYVVILDFIGNYEHNFMIPVALSGDRSYNKDNMRRYVAEGSRVIPGASTIHFDEISRKKIYTSIDHARLSDLTLIKESYFNLKHKLGHIPSLKDFDDYGEIDVLRIFEAKSLGSYYKFLVKYEKDYTIQLTDEEAKVIEYISKKFANGKRPDELVFFQELSKVQKNVLSHFEHYMKDHYHKTIDHDAKVNLTNIMTYNFATGTSRKTYEDCIFIEQDGSDYKCTDRFAKMLAHDDFFHVYKELIDFGLSRYYRDYAHPYKRTNFVLNQKYTYEDVCRLLNWKVNVVAQNIGGYKFNEETKTAAVFINYDKAEDISDTINYHDHFTSEDHLIAISKSGRHLTSKDVQDFLHAKDNGYTIALFIRKNKDDAQSKEFYYLGDMVASGKAREFTMNNTKKTAVEIEWILNHPVRSDLYNYITES